MKNVIEYLDNCSVNQKQQIIDILTEDGLISDKLFEVRSTDNINDEIFKESLKILSTKRHLLTSDQENYINNLAKKFKFI